MKVYITGHFDPCCVHERQRKWLVPLGIEVKTAWEAVYWPASKSDFRPDSSEALEYRDKADLIVVLPAIGQPWSSRPRPPQADDVHSRERRPKLYLFHGSVNLAANLDWYVANYRDRGMLAATTLDYCAAMGVDLVPSIVDIDGLEAPLRGDGDNLWIAHTPTDVRVCNTDEFLALKYNAPSGPSIRLSKGGMSHEGCLRFKAGCHAGFDHLRGSWSINSLENAALGLVNLVGISDKVEALAKDMGIMPDWPRIRTMDDVRTTVEKLIVDPALTRDWQRRSKQWFDANWNPALTAERIAAVYRKAASR